MAMPFSLNERQMAKLTSDHDIALALFRVVDQKPTSRLIALSANWVRKNRGRLGQRTRFGGGHQPGGEIEVGVVGDADAGLPDGSAGGVGLVLDGGADQRLVGHDEFGAAGM